MTVSSDVPEQGFYYHYKHDPNLSINNYAYEFLGVAMHTENDCRPEDQKLAVYLPLYESRAYKAGKFLDARPLSMWLEEVEKNGNKVPRFKKISDEKIIGELRRVKKELYKESKA